MQSAGNVLLNSLRPSNFRVVAAKVLRRITGASASRDAADALAWCEANVEDDAAFADALDARLWAESLTFAEDLHTRARELLTSMKYHLGGGGHYALLYFLVRHLRPAVVVETGVAAGWSSEAILSGLRANSHGVLHSSDFPMVRLARPEAYIGLLVRPENRARWHLYTEGDARNLPRITEVIGAAPIDLVHYDSDKTSRGRRDAIALLAPRFRRGTVLVMDDIQDDLFFSELSRDRRARVFRFERKFLGLIEW